jgi:hypothetical protein
VDICFKGLGLNKPDVKAIVKTIVDNQEGLDDVLFLGGEPCLYLDELLDCVQQIRQKTKLKVYVTTSVPKVCYDKFDVFCKLLEVLDGVNLSVQHYKEDVADQIRRTTSQYDRQAFYRSLPYGWKIRINLNIVKPFLCTRDDIAACLRHYDALGFASIKLSEIQHGKNVYVSFAEVFGIPMKSAYANGCQSYLDMNKILPGFVTPVLLKRSCFLCEDSLKASLGDGVKMIAGVFVPSHNRYGVVYEDGSLKQGWV